MSRHTARARQKRSAYFTRSTASTRMRHRPCCRLSVPNSKRDANRLRAIRQGSILRTQRAKALHEPSEALRANIRSDLTPSRCLGEVGADAFSGRGDVPPAATVELHAGGVHLVDVHATPAVLARRLQ